MKLDKIDKKNIKPFVKWAGGKASLVDELEKHLPVDFDQQDITYIEPFVGGGGMLFYMLTNHQNIRRVIINDINKDLMKCYELVQKTPEILIKELKTIDTKFYSFKSYQERKEFYLTMRSQFNGDAMTEEEHAACFMFLNHTCFNGLYRENGDGGFNVPFGRYKHPTICNEEIIMANHKILRRVELYCGDYSKLKLHLSKKGCNFVYLDPPYRPLSGTSNFMEYSKSGFGDEEQIELKAFCDFLTSKGCRIMMSNSNSLNNDGISFFENLYEGYYIDKILAHRYINVHVEKREKQEELLIKNYDNPKVKQKLRKRKKNNKRK